VRRGGKKKRVRLERGEQAGTANKGRENATRKKANGCASQDQEWKNRPEQRGRVRGHASIIPSHLKGRSGPTNHGNRPDIQTKKTQKASQSRDWWAKKPEHFRPRKVADQLIGRGQGVFNDAKQTDINMNKEKRHSSHVYRLGVG